MLFEIINMTSPVDLFTYSNSITSNIFGIMLLLTIFAITFITFKGYDTETAFATSVFISTLISILMVPLNIIGVGISLIMIILTGVSFMLLFFKKQD